MTDNTNFLALADGTIFHGHSGGAAVDRLGEAVFNTGMSGYQEIISDPSYAGQIVALTAAEIGNYGCNPEDMESRGLFLSGLIVQGLNPPSNYRSQSTLPQLLQEAAVPCLYGVDTRRLTIHLRSRGTTRAYLHASTVPMSPEEGVARAAAWPGLDGVDYAAKVSRTESYVWNDSGDYHIVVFDFGVKYNILRSLAAQGLRITVVPAWTSAAEVMALQPDGVFLSNGPGDPAAIAGIVPTVQELCRQLPVLGICLGHQILGLAYGAQCGRLKFGHHGCNHPVKNGAGEVQITSQNHNFALSADNFPAELDITHINLNDQTVEGLRHKTRPVFSVQFHPEAAPGPHDAVAIFAEFRNLVEKSK